MNSSFVFKLGTVGLLPLLSRYLVAVQYCEREEAAATTNLTGVSIDKAPKRMKMREQYGFEKGIDS